MLPEFILEEIFRSLDPASLLETRLACREFQQLASPTVFRVHTFRYSRDPAYRAFLAARGALFRGLVAKSFPCAANGGAVSLSATFPNLRSLAVGFVRIHEEERLERECAGLVHLRHLSIGHCDRIGVTSLAASAPSLDSLYVVPSHDTVYNTLLCRHGLKSLVMKKSTLANFDLARIERESGAERVALFLDGPCQAISSVPAANAFCRWLWFETESDAYFLRVPYARYKRHERTLEAHLQPELQDCLYRIASQRGFVAVAGIPELADYCWSYQRDGGKEAGPRRLLQGVPSLDLDFCRFGWHRSFKLGQYRAQEVGISFGMLVYREFFQDVGHLFPDLERLHLRDRVTAEMLPLPPNCLAKLVHFHTRVAQPAAFWPELVAAAPRLRCVHTDSFRGTLASFEELKPSLQLMAYRNLWGVPDLKEMAPAFFDALRH